MSWDGQGQPPQCDKGKHLRLRFAGYAEEYLVYICTDCDEGYIQIPRPYKWLVIDGRAKGFVERNLITEEATP